MQLAWKLFHLISRGKDCQFIVIGKWIETFSYSVIVNDESITDFERASLNEDFPLDLSKYIATEIEFKSSTWVNVGIHSLFWLQIIDCSLKWIRIYIFFWYLQCGWDSGIRYQRANITILLNVKAYLYFNSTTITLIHAHWSDNELQPSRHWFSVCFIYKSFPILFFVFFFVFSNLIQHDTNDLMTPH